MNGLGVDILQDFIHAHAVGQADEGKTDARLFGAPGASDAVNIVLVLLGQVVIDDRFHVVHVNASGRHIRGHQNFKLAVFKTVHDLIAQALADIAVNAIRAVTGLFEPFGEPGGHGFGVAEHHHAVVCVAVDDIQQTVILFPGGGLNDVLSDVGLILFGCLNDHLHRVILILPGNGHDVPIGGGGEHHQLAVAGRGLDNFADILHKAHLQHFVGLVQHHGVNPVQFERAAVHVVQQPPRGGHHDLGLAPEPGKLFVHGLAAVNAGNPDLWDILGQFGQLVGDLLGQFPGGTEHNLLNFGFLQVHIFQHGYPECAGFPGSGGRYGGDVVPLHHQRNTLGLHGGGILKAHMLNGSEHFRAYIHLLKNM